jgi:hypothetical protein
VSFKLGWDKRAEAEVKTKRSATILFLNPSFEMFRERSPASHDPPEASVFACLRVALARTLPGDTVEYNGSNFSVAETHGDRFVSIHAESAELPQRVLARDLRLLSPIGRSSEAVATRRTAQVLSCAHEYTIDASGKCTKSDQRVVQRAEWQQYHLLEYGCSDALHGISPVRLIVEAAGRDQARKQQYFQRCSHSMRYRIVTLHINL